MSNGYEDIANAALALPPDARALLAEDLIASLEASQDVIDAAWRGEIERRIKDIKNGKVELISGDQVMDELRARLKG